MAISPALLQPDSPHLSSLFATVVTTLLGSWRESGTGAGKSFLHDFVVSTRILLPTLAFD